MTTISFDTIPDRELLERTERVAGDERHLTAELLALLGECDTRRLYLGEGCSSLFTYCTQVLHFSEHAAYHRIGGARAARQFPVILKLVADGSVTLTTVALLRPHLTAANHMGLLSAARHCTKREVEHQIACLVPKPQVKALIRRLSQPPPLPPSAPVGKSMIVQTRCQPPGAVASEAPAGSLLASALASASASASASVSEVGAAAPVVVSADPRSRVAALAADRYLLRVTLSGEAHARLRHAQELLRHQLPDGDPAAIIDKALSLLVDQLERAKCARVSRPRARPTRPSAPAPASASASAGGSRHIPAATRRQVWTRDEGRCAFVGSRGRCTETGCLEFHHVVPFARGGPTSLENLALRCRGHNGYESELAFGPQTRPQLRPLAALASQEAGARASVVQRR